MKKKKEMIFNKYHKGAIVIILILIVAFFLFPRTQKDTFDKIAIKEFIDNIKEPIEIIDTKMFKDGGTISLQIKDSKDDYFNISLDGRIVVFDEKGRKVKERYLYLNANYHEKEGAIKVPIASNEEKEILRLVREWRENNLEYPEGNFLDIFIERLESRQ